MKVRWSPLQGIVIACAVLLVLTGLLPANAALAAGQTTVATRLYTYFPESGHAVSGSVATFFYQNGGVPIFGYPITPVIQEQGLQVQYFQRARFEIGPHGIALSRVGSEVVASGVAGPASAFARLSAPAPGTTRFFAQTGHDISGDIAQFWISQGGVPLFGYPISEPY